MREKLRTWALTLTGIVAGNTPCQEPPNLLIIQTDEHNFRTLGCYREQMTREQAFMWDERRGILLATRADNWRKS